MKKRKPRIGRPPLPKGERRVRVDFRLRPETVRELDELADDIGCTRTSVIERALAVLAWQRYLREEK